MTQREKRRERMLERRENRRYRLLRQEAKASHPLLGQPRIPFVPTPDLMEVAAA